MTRTATVDVTGPYSLEEVALMGFGHRDEQSFDGVMRLAFATDGATSSTTSASRCASPASPSGCGWS